MNEKQDDDWGPIIFWPGIFFVIVYGAVVQQIFIHTDDIWRMHLGQVIRNERLIAAYKEWLEIFIVLSGIFSTFSFIWFFHLKKTKKSDKENWFLLKDINFTDKKFLKLSFRWAAVFFIGLVLVGFLGRIFFEFIFF